MADRGREKEILVTPTPFRTQIHHGLDAESRIRFAEEVAIPRGLNVSPALRNILSNQTDNFFHQRQQSTQMLEDFQNRQHISFKTMREAVIKQKQATGQQLPNRIPMLDVNPTRITLSLEFEFQYHELMNKQIDNVENVMSIMHRTNTLIQLPDKLNENGASPHAQQVTITGFFNDVEEARIALRENCPLSVYLEIDPSKNNVDHVLACIESNRKSYDNVTVDLDNLPNSGPGLKFTCRQKHIEDMKQTCDNISSMLHKNEREDVYSLRFNVSVYHLDHVVGKAKTNYLLMPIIEQRTKTTISHPPFDAINTAHDHIFPLLVRGSLKNILEARKCITELLPVAMCLNINDGDMAQPIDTQNRVVDVFHPEMKVSMRVTPSKYDPRPLLADEQLQHCITLRTKEFNIRNLYIFYRGLLSASIKLEIPKLHELKSSLWLKEVALDDSVLKFKLPCRGEAPMADKPTKQRSNSKNRRDGSTTKRAENVGNLPPTTNPVGTASSTSRRHQSSSSTTSYTDAPSPSPHHLPPQQQQQQQRHPPLMPHVPFLVQPNMMPNHRFMNNSPVNVQQQHHQQKNQSLMSMQLRQQQQHSQQGFYLYPYFLVPQASDMFPYVPIGPDGLYPFQQHNLILAAQQMSASTSEQNERRDSSSSSQQQQQQLQHREAPPQPPRNNQMRGTYYEAPDDRPKNMPKRGSYNGEDTVVGSYEEDRSYYRQRSGPWKRNEKVVPETYYAKKVLQPSSQYAGSNAKNYRGSPAQQQSHHQPQQQQQQQPGPPPPPPHYFRDREHGVDGGGGNGIVPVEQQQFTSTHTLKLKKNVDEQERLFTQDVSHVAMEERPYSPRKQPFRKDGPSSLNSSFDYGVVRSRTMSVSYDRDENGRFNDNDRMYHGDEQHYRKSPVSAYQSVTKTILEPRSRNEKQQCQKINLEHKDKVVVGGIVHTSDTGAYSTDSEIGSNKVMEFMKIVTQQQQQQRSVIDMQHKNRTYAEILKEREWEKQQQQQKQHKLEDLENFGERNDSRKYIAGDVNRKELRMSSSAPTLPINITRS